MNEISRYTKRSYPLYSCTACGFTRPVPLPYTEATKGDIYDVPENIKFYNPRTRQIDFESDDYKYYFKHFKIFLDLIRKYSIQGKVLDMGCGPGHLLILLEKEGFIAEGQDISPKLAKLLSSRLTIHCAEPESLIKKKKKYDLVTLNQVLEHIEDPRTALNQIHSLLNDEGVLIIAVPYLWGLVPSVLRSYWYGLGYGQHLNFFSKKSLALLLEKAGFTILETKIVSNDYVHPRFPRWTEPIIDSVCMIIAKCGFGDNLFVVARKRENGKN